MTATVSVVVPCFNAAPFLAEALRSAVGQTHPPLEVIVVDDGSTDGSAELAEREPGPIRVLRTAHAGIAPARNAGIAASKGDLIAFLDADDRWPHASLETRLHLWRTAPDARYVFGAIACFDHHSGAAIGEPEVGRLPGAVLTRRGVFDEIGCFDADLRTGEMIDWIPRTDAAGFRFAATAETVLQRRVHAANTTRNTATVHADYFKLLRRNLARRRQAVIESSLASPMGEASVSSSLQRV